MGYALFERDWQFMLDTIYHLNEQNELETFREETLRYIRLNIPYLQGLFYVYTVENNQITQILEPLVVGMEALYLDEFAEKYADDAIFGRYLLAPHCEVLRDTDALPDEVRMQTDWYRNIYAKQGIHYALRVTLVYNNHPIGEIDLFRAREEEDFPDSSMRMLRILAPHIAQKLWKLLDLGQAPAMQAALPEKLSDAYGLTARECEVIAAIAEGKPDRDVAEQLCISTSTLKKHVHNAYRKMGVSNRRQLFAAIAALG